MARSRAGSPHSARSRGRRGDRGSQFIEFAAYFPLLLLICVMVMEFFAGFLALERLGNAARTGARVASTQGVEAGTEAAREALPAWLDQAEVTSGFNDGSYYVQASVSPPFMYPAADLNFQLTRRVHMPDL
ncbi:TadE/TadG family type IV pilus assembly protein [Nocardiopsis potens]|uniref:TadE/TadG family type IV pilus assembly protein n=1 Tax=Nocardiopsis potens TaxID=1246458 RepID=UPI00034DDE22|nr:TadE family protein [Nocardiopsis potens]